MKVIIYEPHPVSVERKKELISKGYKIIDSKFKPKMNVSQQPKKGKQSKLDDNFSE